MRVEVAEATALHFADGTPVRAASAIAVLERGWLIAQDDATHACWLVDAVGTPLRLFPPVDGHDHFSDAAGTKHLKPDLESALEVTVDGASSVLLLGSGSTPHRMRSVLVTASAGFPTTVQADLSPLYATVTTALGITADRLNLEGACAVDGETLRWFNRGLPSAGLPSASVDLDLAAILAAARGGDASDVEARGVRREDLGEANGVGLAVTDAVCLPDGRILVSAAAEDSPTTYDDGSVVAAALALLDGDGVGDLTVLPELDGKVAKVEGLAVVDWGTSGGTVVAVVDADDPQVPSWLLRLWVEL